MKHYFTLTEAGAQTTDGMSDSQTQQTYTTEQKAPQIENTEKKNEQSSNAGGGWSMWIMLALIFGVMWFFMIRPQRKQQKELQKFRDALKRGDKVVTIGGIFGTVVEIKDASVLIEVDNGVKIRVSKQALIKDFSDSQQ